MKATSEVAMPVIGSTLTTLAAFSPMLFWPGIMGEFMGYLPLLASGLEHSAAIQETARDVGSSIFLCAMTTAIGFFAFVPTDFVGVAELGLISGTGMFISLFCTLTLLPALLSLRPIRMGHGNSAGVSWSNASLANLPLRHPRAVRATAVVMGIAAVSMLPKARFDIRR